MSGQLEARAEAVRDCRQALERALTEARSQWDDSVRSKFDQRYAEPALQAGHQIAVELADLASQLSTAMKELDALK